MDNKVEWITKLVENFTKKTLCYQKNNTKVNKNFTSQQDPNDYFFVLVRLVIFLDNTVEPPGILPYATIIHFSFGKEKQILPQYGTILQ